MELDDFKTSARPETWPGSPENNEEITSLVEELKKTDAEARKSTRFFIIIMTVFTVIYIGAIARQEEPLKEGYFMLVAGFLLIAGFLFFKFRRLQNIDYTAPARVFIKLALKRHKFMSAADWAILVIFLGIGGTGGGIIVWFSFLKYMPDPTIALFIYILVIISAVCVGFWSSLKDWKKKKGELYGRIRRLNMDISPDE